MKKIVTGFLMSLLFLFSSCSEDLNPISEYKEVYIVSLVMRGSTTHQVATLVKSYDVNGFDPYQNVTEPSVSGADIRVWQGDSVYVFNQSVVDRVDTSRYNQPKIIYENNSFIMNEQPGDLEVEVLLPFGKRLKGFTRTPSKIQIDESSITTIPSSRTPFGVFWSSTDGEIYYQCRLIIKYVKESDNREVLYQKVVPVSYKQAGDQIVEQYPKPSSQISYIMNQSMIDFAMQQIGEEFTNKREIVIDAASLEILVFDKSLSSYFVSTNNELDGFSIKVDASDYTNIEGGFGIFGSYRYQEHNLKILREYIESFGYQVLNPD